jgi:hypothetical protein
MQFSTVLKYINTLKLADLFNKLPSFVISSDRERNQTKFDQKILDDYLAFFTTKEGADMLPYTYVNSSSLYDNLTKNCKRYYLCEDEIELIRNNQEKLSQHLKQVPYILEIGPGSLHTVEHKTLPMLSYAHNLKGYYALDVSRDYLIETCEFIKKHMPSIIVTLLNLTYLIITVLTANMIQLS